LSKTTKLILLDSLLQENSSDNSRSELVQVRGPPRQKDERCRKLKRFPGFGRLPEVCPPALASREHGVSGGVQHFPEPDKISLMERLSSGLTFIRIASLRLCLCVGITTQDLDEPG